MSKDTAFRIQQVAVVAFKEKGFHNVTIDEICNLAGITKSTFYYHYQSKERLLLDFYDNAGNLTTETLKLLATSDNCWQKLWACIEPSIDWTVEAGAAILSQVFITSIQNQISAFGIGNNLEIIQGIINIGQKTGQFKNISDPKDLFENIRSTIVGIAVLWCIDGGSYDEKQVIRNNLISLLCVRDDLL
jgi:AcrR family transcriptional regulator